MDMRETGKFGAQSFAVTACTKLAHAVRQTVRRCNPGTNRIHVDDSARLLLFEIRQHGISTIDVSQQISADYLFVLLQWHGIKLAHNSYTGRIYPNIYLSAKSNSGFR